MSNPLCFYAVTPKQLEVLLNDPLKLQEIDEWLDPDDPDRPYAEIYCGLALPGYDTLRELVPTEALDIGITSEVGKAAFYMVPTEVREVARKFADVQIENLNVDASIGDELPGLLTFYQAAAKGGKAVVGILGI